MISAQMVKDLREKTGAGMSDCKKALTEAEGNMERAVEILREKGLSALAKKAGKNATEGLSYAVAEGNKAVVLEINSQTDFVAKNDIFVQFVADVAKQILNGTADSVETLLAEQWSLDTNLTVENALSEKVALIGEALSIRRFERVTSDNTLVTYVHAGGKVAVITELTGSGEAVVEAGKNVSMQIAAMSPQFISREDVDADYIAKEKKFLTDQAIAESPGTPENIIEKKIEGRLTKNLKQVCLLEQDYVKDDKQSVTAYLKTVGVDVTVANFVRFETGEGMEKAEVDFAAEVAEAMKG